MNRKSKVGENALRPSYLFASPSLIIYTAIFVLPAILALLFSFTNWSGVTFSLEKIKFMGFDNYIRLFNDKEVMGSFGNSLLMTLVISVVANVGGLCLALILYNSGRLSTFVRAVFFIPYVMSTVAVAFIWMAILSYNGLLNNALEALSLAKLDLFAQKGSAMTCICIVEIWRVLGFFMVLYIAALQGVPLELQEACIIDGGNKWDLFWNIKLPLIAPIIATGLMMSITTEMRIYDLVLILTDGGPGTSTRTAAYSIVTQGFKNWRMGYASAIALILSIMIIVMTLICRKVQGRLEVDN